MAETDGAALGWGPAQPATQVLPEPARARPVSAVGQEGLLLPPRAPCPGRLAGRQLPAAPATALVSPVKSLRFDK